jgi:hypothetical protein
MLDTAMSPGRRYLLLANARWPGQVVGRTSGELVQPGDVDAEYLGGAFAGDPSRIRGVIGGPLMGARHCFRN